MKQPWDVIVVGAGPAGSTAAALLSEQGLRVLVLERETFPRFHIGESLLPAAQAVLERLGIRPSADCFRFKRGAQFVDEANQRCAVFDFSEALAGPARHAWHVDRALFDSLVRDAAVRRGATVRHGVRAEQVRIDERGVSVDSSHGTESARFLIDASGQGRLMARQRNAITPYEHFGKAASFAHFDEVSQRTFDEIGEENDIRIMVIDEGWAWVIPLPGQRLSIGIVTREKGIKAEDVQRYVQSSPLLSRWTDGARSTAPQLVGNFSYRNAHPFGRRYACIGDAACFIDPVFSSGVSLAMSSALRLAERLIPALSKGQESRAELMSALGQSMSGAYDVFASLVYRFYNTLFVQRMIFGAPEDGELRSSVISVFAGDVFRSDNPFAQMLRRSRIEPRKRPPSGAVKQVAPLSETQC